MESQDEIFKRFLHYGKQTTLYQPGSRFLRNEYHPTNLPSLDSLIGSEKFADVAGYVVKAFTDGYSAHPEMLVYALVLCVKQKESVQMRAAAYKALSTISTTPESLFLFLKFSKLQPTKSVWGRGLRKVLKEWYLMKDAKTLAEIVTKKKRYHGWSHKDVIKMIHLKTDDPAKAAVIKYVFFGLAAAKREYGDAPGTSGVLNYIQSVEDFKRMTDEQQAARTLETLNLTLEHIPSHLLKSKEVWNALIGKLPLGELIKNLERIGYLGFLKTNCTLVQRIFDALHDESKIAQSRLHPAQVFVTLRNYEMSSKFMAAEMAQRKQKAENGSGEARKIVKIPPKPNMRIVRALYDLYMTCNLFLAPTGLRYLVVIDLKNSPATRPNEKCFRCPHVSPYQAAAVTTLCLLHADQNVDVRGYRQKELLPLDIKPRMSVEKCLETMNEFSRRKAADDVMSSIGAVVTWASNLKQEHDVFVYITDHFRREPSNTELGKIVSDYRKDLNLPNAKFITVSLANDIGEWSYAREHKVFYIAGFDSNVPRIIEAFSRGAF